MQRFLSPITRMFEHALVVAMAVLVIDVVWQVFTRYVLGHQSSWTEELATILLMWAALLGACVAFARDAHLGLDFFVKKLDSAPQKTVERYVHATTLLFGAVLVAGGYELAARTLATNQTSPALGWKMGYVYTILPLSGVYIALLAIEKIMSSFRSAPSDR
jgi:TRAP-type C4-dicarboxylate transport system permease small subunit